MLTELPLGRMEGSSPANKRAANTSDGYEECGRGHRESGRERGRESPLKYLLH